jgi:hypothetical protein
VTTVGEGSNDAIITHTKRDMERERERERKKWSQRRELTVEEAVIFYHT